MSRQYEVLEIPCNVFFEKQREPNFGKRMNEQLVGIMVKVFADSTLFRKQKRIFHRFIFKNFKVYLILKTGPNKLS